MTSLVDTDLLIMHHLKNRDLYHLCLSNYYFLNLCRHDPILTKRFETYRYHINHPLKGIHPETGKNAAYKSLLNKYYFK